MLKTIVTFGQVCFMISLMIVRDVFVTIKTILGYKAMPQVKMGSLQVPVDVSQERILKVMYHTLS